jgi:hypothetical protein
MCSHRPLQIVVLLLLLGFSPAADARKFLDAINDADRAILNDLHSGQITWAQPFGANGNTGSLWKVKVEHEGRTRWAMFKPRGFGDRDGWARTPMEVAMYKLNRIVGMDLIPPAAYRRGVTLNGQYFTEGALLHWVEDTHLAGPVARDQWRPRPEAFSSDLRILATLGRDADHENSANVIRGRHWADGKYRVMKVDNEACLRPGAYVNLEHNSATWGSITRFNPHTYARLKELSFDDLKGDLGSFVSDAELRQLLSIRDGIVGYVREQVRQRGREQVFLSDAEIGYDARLRLGPAASRAQLHKFMRKMKRKGVAVELVSPRDPRLKGALGRTMLGRKGITVRLSRSKLRLATLVEELVHVNQLRSLSRSSGGLGALHLALQGDGRRPRAIRASLEAYAKGKLRLCKLARTKQERKQLGRSQRRYSKQVRQAGGCGAPGTFWRRSLRAKRVAH